MAKSKAKNTINVTSENEQAHEDNFKQAKEAALANHLVDSSNRGDLTETMATEAPIATEAILSEEPVATTEGE